MPTLSQSQVIEVNEIIEKIEKAMKPKCEIGAQSRAILTPLLNVHKVKKKPKFFSCKPEFSETIVNFFVNEKGLVKSRFHMNSRDSIFLLL